MEIVVDKGFLKSFFTYNSSERHKAVYDDFVKFINRLQPGFILVSNFSSLEEVIAMAEINPLLEVIADKSSRVELVPDFEQTLSQREYHENSCSLKLCLVDFGTKVCSQLEAAFGYSFISGENLAYKWKAYTAEREDWERLITSSAGIEDEKRFDSWKTLEKYKHPLNAILIVDKYILTDKSNQPINQNLKPLLAHLLPKKKCEMQVDITIIAEQEDSSQRREPGKFEAVYKDLQNYLAAEFPDLAVNLTIIKLNKDLLFKLPKEGFRIHDRRVITNYFCLKTGIGFNLFDKKGRVEDSDSELEVRFNLYGYNSKTISHMLKGYAAYAGIATEVYGTNNNRLLTQFQPKINRPAAATA